jgi:hypothetical protein
VRRGAFFRKPSRWLLLLGLAALVLGAGSGWGETLTVTQPNQQLYPDPDFASAPLGPVPQGTPVNVLKQSGDWYQVDYQGKTGWLPRQAFPEARGPKFSLPGLLFGGPVKESRTDEVALAGKGFTPEVEASYRSKHPEMKFAHVDQVEAFRVDEGKLQAFIKEGGLKP